MKNILGKTIAMIGIALIMSACNEKESALEELRDMAVELNENADKMKAEEWVEVLSTYSKLDSIISNNEYTAEELEEIGRLQGECLGHFTKNKVKEAKKKIEKAASQFKGIMEGFEEVLRE